MVVGGGVVGASTAYHLARLGAGANTVLLESNKLTSGTTWHSAAMINSLRGDVVDGLLAAHTKSLVASVLEEETGVSPGFKRHGGLTVTSNPEMMTQFLRERDVARYTSNSALLLSPTWHSKQASRAGPAQPCYDSLVLVLLFQSGVCSHILKCIDLACSSDNESI